eukprot:TRINITY_DN2336_c0_g1_i2.p1 TRINITY_DN2336_c0_g1~~TRINITY_DN2336_c0_g1_i2.p1  ORF type:complete len:826 (-),score=194.76 TRINITY_DN2336_c0_g1_i2:44-2521(-)
MPLFSLQEIKALKTLLELVVAWGVQPCLLPGVGAPLRHTAGTAQVNLSTTRKGTTAQLHECAYVLLSLARSPQLSEVLAVLTRHAADLLASLLQLAHTERQPMATECASWIADNAPVTAAMDSLFALIAPRDPSPPVWLRKQCRLLLARVTMRRGGVAELFERTLGSPRAQEHAGAADATVRALTTPPDGVDRAAYYEHVFGQLTALLAQVKPGSDFDYVIQPSVTAIGKILEEGDDLASRCVSPLLLPFAACSDSPATAVAMQGAVLFAEGELTWRLEVILQLLTLDVCVAETFSRHLDLVFYGLFRLGSVLHASLHMPGAAPQLRQHCGECLAAHLRACRDAAACLRRIAVPHTAAPHARPVCTAETIAVVTSDETSEAAEAEATYLCELLRQVGRDDFTSAVFVEVVTKLEGCKASPILWERSMHLLSMLCEKFDATFMKNLSEVAAVLKVMLGGSDPEILAIALKLIQALVTPTGGKSGYDAITDGEQLALLLDTLPVLERLSCAGPPVGGAAEDALSAVVAACNRARAKASRGPPLLEPAGAPRTTLPVIIKELLEDLRSDAVADRGLALVTLRRMVLDGEPAVRDNVAEITEAFLAQLSAEDDDEALYGAAACGLATLCDVHADAVLPLLAARYRSPAEKPAMRLKLGEALLHAALLQGEMLPHYAPLLVHAALVALKSAATAGGAGAPLLSDEDAASLRASGLSLLATLCRHLTAAALGPYVVEVASAAAALLGTDLSPCARRGAAYVAALLARGLGRELPRAVPGTLLRELRLRLEAASWNDTDDIVRQHAADALANFEAAALQFVTPNAPPGALLL